MEFSKLNQRIIFLENRTVVDEIGNHTSKWEEAFCVWVYVTVSKSDEVDHIGITQKTQMLNFWVRENSYTRSITSTKYRLMF
ncbi:MAG: phage head closure protein [Ruminococcus sp.]|nr:phage head closure protein [Ruminococcus sp.]